MEVIKIPSVSLDLLAKDNASAAIKGMTGSILSANIAMDGLRKLAMFAADSIGNAVKSNDEYKKITDDVTTNVSALSMALGGSLVNALKGSLTSLKDFTNESNNIKNIGGSFAILIEFGRRLITDVFDALKIALSPVVDLFKSFSEKGDTASGAMKTLAVVMEVLKSTLTIVGTILKLIIQSIIDFIGVVIEAGKTIGTFFETLSGKKKWSDVKNQFDETGKSINLMAKNIVANGKNIIDESVNQFQTFNDRAKKSTQENIKIFKDGGDQALSAYKDAQAKILAEQAARLKKEEDAEKKSKLDEQKKIWDAYSSAIIKNMQDITSTLQNIMQRYYDDQINAVSKWKDDSLEQIDEWADNQMEIQGVREETESERLQREISELQASITSKTKLEDKVAIQKTIKEKQDELKRTQIKDEAEKKRNEIEKQANEKTTELKKQQFEQNKAIAIANVWINAAAGIVGAWAGAAQWPGVSMVAGMVLAGVLTGLILTMAGVQTGLIASQQFTAEEGGVIPGTSYTGDKINVGINSMERVLTPEQNKAFEQLVFNGASNREPLLIQVMLDRKVLVEALVQNQKDERIR